MFLRVLIDLPPSTQNVPTGRTTTATGTSTAPTRTAPTRTVDVDATSFVCGGQGQVEVEGGAASGVLYCLGEENDFFCEASFDRVNGGSTGTSTFDCFDDATGTVQFGVNGFSMVIEATYKGEGTVYTRVVSLELD
jgi:hypothetical protein